MVLTKHAKQQSSWNIFKLQAHFSPTVLGKRKVCKRKKKKKEKRRRFFLDNILNTMKIIAY